MDPVCLIDFLCISDSRRENLLAQKIQFNSDIRIFGKSVER